MPFPMRSNRQNHLAMHSAYYYRDKAFSGFLDFQNREVAAEADYPPFSIAQGHSV
jgi:hypothetical protein